MKFIYPVLPIVFCFFANYLSAYAQDKKIIKITKSNRVDPFSVEKQLASFSLPEGFIIELVASEKNGVINPIDLTFDDAGRLWTQTAEMYPMDPFGNKANRTIRAELLNPKSNIREHPGFKQLDRLYKLQDRGSDRVLVINNPTKKVEGQVDIVAEGLTMPQSILPYKNGVYIAHGSEMLYMSDEDGDGKYEKASTVLTGFSFIDSHTMSHTLVRGPGGWVHFSHGAMNLGQVTAVASGESTEINYSKIARFSLDGKKIELVSSGLNNIWGFQLRADGQWYGAEANDKGHSVVPMEPMTGFLGIGNGKLRGYQPMVPVIHKFRVGGTGISGLAFSDDAGNGFPEEWRNLAFLANPITNTINTVRVDRDAEGNVSGTHLEDLLKSTDDWFRPVNIEFGPDGCLYIADWYNKVVSHNEVPRTDPSRDKSHGRIWRIRHESQKPVQIPNLIEANDADLAKHLLGNSRWEKRAAWHQIEDRQVKSLIPQIKQIALNPSASIGSRIHAIWSFESLGEFDENFITSLLNDENHNVRREAIRSIASFDLPTATIVKLLKPLLEDNYCMVRSQVLRTLEEVNKPDQAIVELLVSACKPEIPGNAMGGAYERNFERFLARKALETYANPLIDFLNTQQATKHPVSHLLWALQALPKDAATKAFAKFWKLREQGDIDVETFVSISNLLNDKMIYSVVKPYFDDANNHAFIMNLVIDNEDRINTKNLQKVLQPAVVSLIKSQSSQDQVLAMQVATILKLSSVNNQVTEIAKQTSDAYLLNEALPLLLLNTKANQGILKQLALNESFDFNLRLNTINAFNKANIKEATPILTNFINGKSDAETQLIINTLSQSQQGAQALVDLVAKKMLTTNDFDLASAQRIKTSLKENPVAAAILAKANQIETQRVKQLDAKVLSYVKAVETLKGNPAIGQGLFQSCLACHQVGDQGYEIAPALDGSATRELHALITAIVNPDVAVEGGYNLHRVTRKNGTTVEGYLFKQNAQGITIAQMGNVQTFIPKADIKSEGAVAGKSFMPSMFSDLPEQTMVDLVSYIKTLK